MKDLNFLNKKNSLSKYFKLVLTILCFYNSLNAYSDCPVPVGGDVTKTSGGSFTLEATTTPHNLNNNTRQVWYDAASGGNVITSGVNVEPSTTNNPDVYITTLTVTVSQTTSYWVSTVSDDCTSSRTKITAIVSVPTCTNPYVSQSGNNTNLCEGDPFTFYGNNGSNYSWYEGSANFKASGPSYSPTISGNYYMKAQNSCGEDKTTVAIPVTFRPKQPGASDHFRSYFHRLSGKWNKLL